MRRLTLLLLALAVAACTGGNPARSGTRLLKRPDASSKASASPTATPTDTRPDTLPTPTPAAQATATPTPSPAPTATPPAGGIALVTGGALSATWLPGPSLHRPRAGLAAGVVAGRLFAIEGESRPSLEALDASGAWTLDASYDLTLPHFLDIAAAGGRTLVTGVTGNTGVVLAGGQTGSGKSRELLFYTKDGFAGAVGAFAQPFVAAAGGKVDGGVAVAGGLNDAGAVVTSLRLWDVASELESAGPAMPRGVAGATGAVLGGKLYVLGGYTLDGEGQPVASTAVQVYDPTTNSWRWSGDGQAGAPAVLPAARHSAAAEVIGDTLYLVGGAGADGAALASGLRYEAAGNAWIAIAPLPTARALHALVAFEGALWAIGGFGADRLPLTSVEVYHP